MQDLSAAYLFKDSRSLKYWRMYALVEHLFICHATHENICVWGTDRHASANMFIFYSEPHQCSKPRVLGNFDNAW